MNVNHKPSPWARFVVYDILEIELDNIGDCIFKSTFFLVNQEKYIIMKNLLMVLLFFILVGCCVSPPDAVYFSVYNDKGKSAGISFSTTDGLSVEDLSIEPYAVALFELDNPGGCFWKKEREFEKVVINGKEIGNLSPSGCIYSPMVCCYIIRGDSVFLRQIEYSDYGINGDGESLNLYEILKSKPKFGEYKILHEYK